MNNIEDSWICVDCRDYNNGEDNRCVYCGIWQEFSDWLWQVDLRLAERLEITSRADLPYLPHQWWELWDHCVDPETAVITAILLSPAETKPWPEHVYYSAGNDRAHAPTLDPDLQHVNHV